MNLKEMIEKRNKDKLSPICDMAIEQDKFEDRCTSLSTQVYLNMAKICLFDDNGLQKHWAKEMVGALIPLMRLKLKIDKGSKSQSKKRESFIKTMITDFLGENYEEYDYDSMKELFVAAIMEEGYNLKDFDIKSVVEKNKGCFINYFEKLKKINFLNFYTELWDYATEFIDDVRAIQ